MRAATGAGILSGVGGPVRGNEGIDRAVGRTDTQTDGDDITAMEGSTGGKWRKKQKESAADMKQGQRN